MCNITKMDIREFCEILKSVGEDTSLVIEMYSDWRSNPTTIIKGKTFQWTSKLLFKLAFNQCTGAACS